MEPKTLLLTGVSGIGKTTLLQKVVSSLKGYRIRGLLTNGISRTEGASVSSCKLKSGKSATLAHVDLKSNGTKIREMGKVGKVGKVGKAGKVGKVGKIGKAGKAGKVGKIGKYFLPQLMGDHTPSISLIPPISLTSPEPRIGLTK
jgi:hypothetical protein